MEQKRSFDAIIKPGAKLLILGSMPGDESLNRHQYYAHPRNDFWPIMGSILGFDPALPYGQRLGCLTDAGIGLWDVLESCIRPGSLDSNIRQPVPNDIAGLVETCPGIRMICCNGGASYTYLKRYLPGLFRSDLIIRQLPSTSPAAARLRREEKREIYRTAILEALE